MDISVTREDGLMRIAFDRPAKKNAITAAMYESLTDALVAAARDPAVRVAIIHGSGGAFTAGNDLEDFIANRPSQDGAPVFRFVREISRFGKPLVAAVLGPAVGIGTTLLLHCDLVYAGQGAKFSLPFARLGLCPEGASSYLLARLVGRQRAAEKLMLAEPFGAAEAQALGFVNAVLPDDAVIDHALERARTLAALPASSLQATKALLLRGIQRGVLEQLECEGLAFRSLLESPAAAEAIAAFIEKRKPDFSTSNGEQRAPAAASH